MNVYDFDNTIFYGDSTARFYLFALKRHPCIIKFIPRLVIAFTKHYVFKIGTKTQFKEQMYSFLKCCDINQDVKDFWDKNIKGIKSWYIHKQKADDVIISASPEFLILPVCQMLNIKYAMASIVNPKNGKYTGVNCHGAEKVRRFYERFPDGNIDEFYSDSYSDTPLAEISKASFIVKGENIRNWVFRN